MKTAIDDPVSFMLGLGGLHDADVKRLLWDPVRRLLHLGVDDLHANLAGLPEYPGLKPCTLVFAMVDFLDVRCDVQSEDCVRIYGLQATRREKSGYALTLQLSPSGQINLHFESVAVEDTGD